MSELMNFKRILKLYFTKLLEDHRIPTNLNINEKTGRFRTGTGRNWKEQERTGKKELDWKIRNKWSKF